MITNKKCLLAGLVLAVVVSVGMGSTVKSASENIAVFDCADLQVCFSLDSCANIASEGCPVDLTIVLTNNSGFDVDDLEMDVDYSAITNDDPLSVTGTGYVTNDDTGTGTWTVPTVTAGGTQTLILELTRPATGCYQVTGTLRSLDPTFDSIGWVGDFIACAELCVENPRLCLQLCSSSSSPYGDDNVFCRESSSGVNSTVDYLVKVINDGPCGGPYGFLEFDVTLTYDPSELDFGGIYLQSTASEGVATDDGAGTITWTGISLDDGDCAQLSLPDVEILASGSISVSAAIANGPDCVELKAVACSEDITCPIP